MSELQGQVKCGRKKGPGERAPRCLDLPVGAWGVGGWGGRRQGGKDLGFSRCGLQLTPSISPSMALFGGDVVPLLAAALVFPPKRMACYSQPRDCLASAWLPVVTFATVFKLSASFLCATILRVYKG